MFETTAKKFIVLRIALLTALVLAIAPIMHAGINVLQEFTFMGGRPRAALLQASDGNVYGVLSAEGGYGAIYKIVPNWGSLPDSTLTILHVMELPDGRYPSGPLVEKSGWLYGTTSGGGAFNRGTIFRIDLTGTFERLYSFTGGTDGSGPLGLTRIGDAIYGAADGGGSASRGVLFVLTESGTPTIIHDFKAGEGSTPRGLLADGGDGRLYGLTRYGGTRGMGTLFVVDPRRKKDNFLTLHSFDGDTTDGLGGIWPAGGLARIGQSLYGVTYRAGSAWNDADGGMIFRLDLSSAPPTVSTLHAIVARDEGMYSNEGLLASGGNLWGATGEGGLFDCGTVYRVSPDGTFAVKASFAYPDRSAAGPLVEIGGMLWGVTSGDFDLVGSIFAFDGESEGAIPVTVHTFERPNAPRSPQTGQMIESGPDIYGVTSGDMDGGGAVFKLTPGGDYETLYQFPDEIEPLGWLTPVGGWFYGATHTRIGAAASIFRIDSAGTVETLHSFPDDPNQISFMRTSLVEHDGYLYGGSSYPSDYYGSSTRSGAIFRMRIDDPSIVEAVHVFTGPDGAYPKGTMTVADGYLYGTTQGGGSGNSGTVYRFHLPFGPLETLFSFSGPNGAGPSDGVTIASDGRLYGTTPNGGSMNLGVLFRIDVSSGPAFGQILHSFTPPDGAQPHAGLVEMNGMLYGTTSWGGGSGSAGDGSIFRFDPVAETFTVAHVFGGSDGEAPLTRLLAASDHGLYGSTMSGGRSGGGVLFRFTENEAPVLAAVGNRTAAELTAITIQLSATDADAGQTLTYSIESGSRPGMRFDSQRGVFLWVPTEEEGPGTYAVTFRVTDDGAPGAFDEETIEITVSEAGALDAKLSIINGNFSLSGTFTPSSNGVNPLAEDVVLGIGTYAMPIPAGAFKATADGVIAADGVYGGVRLSIQLKPLKGGVWSVKANGRRLSNVPDPANVWLTIGDETVATRVKWGGVTVG